MDFQVSGHGKQRMQQRGVTAELLTKILDNADIERPANDNCRLYRVTRQLAGQLHDDRLARFAVIWSDDKGLVVTVLPISSGRAGAAYRKRH